MTTARARTVARLAAAVLSAAGAAGAQQRAREPAVATPPPGTIERLDPRLDRLVPHDARVETIARGFRWVEGPAWDAARRELLFSDIPANAIHRWRDGAGTTLFLQPSGHRGTLPFAGREPGSNGLTFDAAGRLLVCEHGERCVSRIDRDGVRTVLADAWRGRRLNSPNDVVVCANGDLCFTDPAFGLPRGADDPARELSFAGVFRRATDGTVTLLTRELPGPNGLGFAPDERTLYVSNADAGRPAWFAFAVRDDGSLGPGRVFVDARAWVAVRPGFPDGMAVDAGGNLFAAGPGGVYVFAPDGSHLGTIHTGVATSNCELGGPAGDELFVTADSEVLRVRLTARARRR